MPTTNRYQSIWKLSSAGLLIALLILAIVLWDYNTVASIVLFTASFGIVVFYVWSSILQRAETSAAYYSSIRRERNATYTKLAEIESRMHAALEQPKQPVGYEMDDFDYPELPGNTIADYDEEVPVSLIDGIDTAKSDQLGRIGISDIDELAIADPEEIAHTTGVSKQVAEEWILDAKAMFVGAQISSLIPLSMSEGHKLLAKINNARNTGALKLPIDHDLSISKIDGWINRANELVSAIDVSEIQKLLDDHDK
jgi:hypothetical protein